MNKLTIKTILVLGGLVVSILGFVLYFIYQLQNPDMTTLRLFLSNPWPTCICASGWLMVLFGNRIR